MPDILDKHLETLTFNIGGPGVSYRWDTFDGKQYMVAPMAMLEEGVREGSQGKLYYPGEELGRNPSVWNHKPIIVNHPEENGKPIIACTPTILDSRGIGLIFHTKHEDKLKAEAWIDPIKAKRIEPRVIEALEKGEKMEGSTGLFTKNTMTPGVWNNQPYDGIASNYQPDHYALLPDKIGAYSIKDGGGLLANSAAEDDALCVLNDAPGTEESVLSIYKDKYPAAKREAIQKDSPGDFAGPHRSFPIKDQEDVNNAARLVGHADDPAAVKRKITAIAKKKGLKLPASWKSEKKTPVKNESPTRTISHENLRSMLRDKLRETKPSSDPTNTGTQSSDGGAGENGIYDYKYIEDVYDSFFIYSDSKGGMSQQNYEVMDNAVSFTGKPTPVKRVTEYRSAADNSFVGNSYTQISLRELEMVDNPTRPLVNTTMDDSGTAVDSGKGSVPAPPILKGPEPKLSKDAMVNTLITGGSNGTVWGEGDRTWLSGLDENRLSQLMLAQNLKTPGTVDAAAKQGAKGTTSPQPNPTIPTPDKKTDLTGDSNTPHSTGPALNQTPNQPTNGGTPVANDNTQTLVAPTANNTPAPVAPVAAAPPAVPVVQAAPAPVIQAGIILNAQQAAAINRLVEQNNKRREELIGVITANKRNKFNPDHLRTMQDEELEGMASLAAPEDKVVTNAINPLLPNYAGQGGGAFMPPAPILANAQQQQQNDPIANFKPLSLPRALRDEKEKEKVTLPPETVAK